MTFDRFAFSRPGAKAWSTFMAQPADTYGTIATQLLLDRLSGRVAQRRRIVVLPADFVVRKSSGAPAPAPAEAG